MIICPSCLNNIDDNKYIREYYSKEVNINYKLYHCNKCDLEFWVPLEFVRKIYEEEILECYERWHKGLGLLLSENHKYLLKYFLKKIKERVGQGRLLDVGCGDGSFIKRMEQEGFEVYGIDIDSKSIRIAKENLTLKNVYTMSLSEFVEYSKSKGLTFDVISFFEVLEHQADPVKFLNEVKSILSNKGVVVGTVPNRNRAFAELTRNVSKTAKNYDFPPHHFMWFSSVSLKNLFNAVGFDCVVQETKVDIDTYADRVSNFIHYLTKFDIFDTDILHNRKKSSKIKRIIALGSRYMISYPLGISLKLIYETIGGFGLFFYASKSERISENIH